MDYLIKKLVIDNSFGNPTYTPDKTYDHCHFFLFLLTTVCSVLLRLTASDYPFWCLQTFLQLYKHQLYIEEEQTTQWPKEKVQRTNNDLQNIHIKLKIEYLPNSLTQP